MATSRPAALRWLKIGLRANVGRISEIAAGGEQEDDRVDAATKMYAKCS